jgi:hypothetical protein
MTSLRKTLRAVRRRLEDSCNAHDQPVNACGTCRATKAKGAPRAARPASTQRQTRLSLRGANRESLS